jgi:hypothetical protein
LKIIAHASVEDLEYGKKYANNEASFSKIDCRRHRKNGKDIINSFFSKKISIYR